MSAACQNGHPLTAANTLRQAHNRCRECRRGQKARERARRGPVLTLTPTERFWTRVDRAGGPAACWPWIGARNSEGRGHVVWDGRRTGAPRVALLLSGRRLAPGELACHRCDNPPCCNPAHLFAGTYADNANDMYAKGRHPYTRDRGPLPGALTAPTPRVVSFPGSGAPDLLAATDSA